MTECWNRCDECGRFIAFEEFGRGAVRVLITPDSEFTNEEYETLCSRHAEQSIGPMLRELEKS